MELLLQCGLVQTRIDSTTRVCAYDRAGLGWSDSSQAEETVEAVVSDLHKLLKAAGEKGPYLLVGASIAGTYIQAYQHAYPKEVAGLVFTNSSNRIGFMGKNKGGLIWDLTEDDIRPSFPVPAANKNFKPPTKPSEPFNHLPPQLQRARLQLSNQLYLKWNTASTTADGLLSSRKEFLREFNESDKFTGSFPLGNLPVVVVASDPMAPDSLRYTRTVAAARLDYLSSNSVHIIASGSGHEIHLYQPDVVVDALRRAVIAIRKKIPLAEVPALR